MKLLILQALVWPVITYGSEAWTIKKADAKRIDAAEMWIYRRLLRISWHTRRSNVSILAELGTERELLPLVKRKKLVSFGHLCRGGGLTRDIVAGYHPKMRT